MNKNTFAKYWWLGLPIVIFVLYKAYVMFRTAGKIGKNIGDALKNDSDILSIQDALKNNNIGNVRANVIEDISNKINDAIWHYWGGMMEDEDAAMVAFNSLANISEAKACAVIYAQTSEKKHSLYADLDEYCQVGAIVGTNFKTSYLNAIKNL